MIFTMTGEEYRFGQEDYQGLCIVCGEEHYGVEPDAERYGCTSCKEHAVFGIEQLLLIGRLQIEEVPACS